MISMTFVMEQHLGHQTYYQNVRRFVERDPNIRSRWIPVTYETAGSLWRQLPLLPRGLRSTLSGRFEVRQGLASVEPGIVFFNTQVPAALAGRRISKMPYVVATDLTPRQYDQIGHLYGHRPDRFRLLGLYKHRVNRAVLRGAARLLPWSNWARESLIADYGADSQRIEVLPPGVDLNRWFPGPKRSDGPVRILFVGGDLWRKGGNTLLQAFRSLPRGSAELVLVTRTPFTPEEGVLVHHGLQPNSPELLALFQSSDIFAFPTEAEAFGIAAIEASAAGLPVVATSVGGLPDVVSDGETGYLLQPGDVPALAKSLGQLVEDLSLRERMGRAARARAERHFDAGRNVERLIAILQQAIPDV